MYVMQIRRSSIVSVYHFSSIILSVRIGGLMPTGNVQVSKLQVSPPYQVPGKIQAMRDQNKNEKSKENENSESRPRWGTVANYRQIDCYGGP